ncbi:MAG: hypothetical protein JWM80_2950 [Cyanobacteria bacterium RYN_339]|nr:hypothetical protein [Cyanobacteria bacterium RYN_339]
MILTSRSTPIVTIMPLMQARQAASAMCVLCEQVTLVPLPWQDGASACCRHCFRSQRRRSAG